jgi:hypothetical protein
LQTVQIETDGFICYLPMQAGGYAVVQQQDRSSLGLPPNPYCATYDLDGTRRAVTDIFAERGLSPADRNVRFVVTADPQYDNANPKRNASADTAFQTIRGLLGESDDIRGVLVAGDLTQNSEPSPEYSSYQHAISGLARYFFEGEGNHDLEHPPWECIFSNSCSRKIIADIHDRKHATALTNRDGSQAHYSWDWHDVHFVQLGLYPGNGTVDQQYDRKDPGNSLDFLRHDLATYVGNSGRPVVLVHHYGFDGFSTGDSAEHQRWWTDEQRAAYWDVIAPYNVVAIFVGHVHLEPGDDFQFPFRRPAGRTVGPPSIPSFVAGATFNGVFLDVTIDASRVTVLRRHQSGGVDRRAAVFVGHSLVVDQGNGFCLDVSANNPADGASAIGWSCHGGDNQRFDLAGNDGGYLQLVARHSGKCLDSLGASSAINNPFVQWPCTGSDNQLFSVLDGGDGRFSFVAKHSGLCLDIASGTAVQSQCSGSATQRFSLRLHP